MSKNKSAIMPFLVSNLISKMILSFFLKRESKISDDKIQPNTLTRYESTQNFVGLGI